MLSNVANANYGSGTHTWSASSQSTFTRAHTHTHTHTHLRTHSHTHTHTYAHSHTHTHLRKNALRNDVKGRCRCSLNKKPETVIAFKIFSFGNYCNHRGYINRDNSVMKSAWKICTRLSLFEGSATKCELLFVFKK